MNVCAVTKNCCKQVHSAPVVSCTRSSAYFHLEAKTQLITDAGPVRLGRVLIQVQNGEPRPVCYVSRVLTDVERKYSQTQKKALAIVWACERLHLYLYGIKFELLTDHKPLEMIYCTRSKPSARIKRWVLRLQQYNFVVRYIPGPKNVADPLSRLSLGRPADGEHEVEDDGYVLFVAIRSTPRAVKKSSKNQQQTKNLETSSTTFCQVTGEMAKRPSTEQPVQRFVVLVSWSCVEHEW